jgi:hypothetical protein
MTPRRICPRCGAPVAHSDGIYAVCPAGHVWRCRMRRAERARADGDEILRELYREGDDK